MLLKITNPLSEKDWKLVLGEALYLDSVYGPNTRKELIELPTRIVQSHYVAGNGKLKTLPTDKPEAGKQVAQRYVAFMDHYAEYADRVLNRWIAISAVLISFAGLVISLLD